MEIKQRSRPVFWIIKRRTQLLLAGFVLLLLLLILWPRMIFIIESGHAGVVYRTFWGGTVTTSVRDEGLQIISPWNTLTIYDVRLQQIEQQFSVISNDGLEVKVLLAIRYAPKVELLGLLHRKIGPDYLNKIVIPDVHALIRTTFGQYSPEEIYRTKRSLIQETFQSALSNLGDKYVEMDDLLIKSIELPETVRQAIENKHVEQQLMLQMHFRVDREKFEAQRKEIEASGVDRFQTIVSRSLTPQLLQYKGIEAMTKLAQSPNAKLVLAGGGSNGVPLILDTTSKAAGRDQAVLNLAEGLEAELPTSKVDEGTALDRRDNLADDTEATPSPHPTPTVTPAVSPHPTPTVTPAVSPNPTPTVTPAVSPNPSPSPSPTSTPSPQTSPTPSPQPSPTAGAAAETQQPKERRSVTSLIRGFLGGDSQTGPATPAPSPTPR